MSVPLLTGHSDKLASIFQQSKAHTLNHHLAVGGRCTGILRGCGPLLPVRIGLLLSLWCVGSSWSGRCPAGCRIHERAVLE